MTKLEELEIKIELQLAALDRYIAQLEAHNAELLAALESSLDLIEAENLDELHGDLAEVARAAIAKAKE